MLSEMLSTKVVASRDKRRLCKQHDSDAMARAGGALLRSCFRGSALIWVLTPSASERLRCQRHR